jgi:hypothetical protein
MPFIAVVIAVCCSAPAVRAQEAGTAAPGKVLFVHDKVVKQTKTYIDAYRDGLKAAGLTVDETAVDSAGAIGDVTPYTGIVLYCRVMAFGNKSPVRDWLEKQKSLAGKAVFLFVTANRWKHEKHRNDMVELIKARGGDVVDAVAMATAKLTESEKRDAVAKQAEKVK